MADADQTPLPLPATSLTRLAPGVILSQPLSRKGSGPGLIVLVSQSGATNDTSLRIENGVPSPLMKWGEESYTVVELLEEAVERVALVIGAVVGRGAGALLRLLGQVRRDLVPVLGVDFHPATDNVVIEHEARIERRAKHDFAGRRVTQINRVDGVKFYLADGSWLLLRPSGTEPLVRIYAESPSQTDLEVLLEQGREYLLD